jgi:hypothetical protein
MITENLSTLEIHKLTQAQYERLEQAGTINENAIYLTPDDGSDRTGLPVVIEEFSPEVEAIIDTVLETRMTPDEALAASKCGLFLKVMQTDGQWNMYSMTSIANDGSYVIFHRVHDNIVSMINIDIMEDGMMVVGDADMVEIKGGVTKTTLWTGSVNVPAESSGGSIPLTFTPGAYDFYDVVVEYGGYSLGKTAVRCYPIINASASGYDGIAGRLIWNALHWLQLDVWITEKGGILLGCIYRQTGSSSFSTGGNTFTVSKIVGYKLNAS